MSKVILKIEGKRFYSIISDEVLVRVPRRSTVKDTKLKGDYETFEVECLRQRLTVLMPLLLLTMMINCSNIIMSMDCTGYHLIILEICSGSDSYKGTLAWSQTCR